jgi:hypothetical protein
MTIRRFPLATADAADPMRIISRLPDLTEARGGHACPRCGGSAVLRPGGTRFCYACGPQLLEELAVRAHRAGLITVAELADTLGLETGAQAAVFADLLDPYPEPTSAAEPTEDRRRDAPDP